MRILYINTVFGNGSTGKIICDTARLLLENGHTVKVVYGVNSNHQAVPYETVCVQPKAEYYFHNALSRITDHAGQYSVRATRRLIYEVEKFQPDIIHLHTLHGYYVNYRILFEYLRQAGIAVVWTHHDCWAFTGHCTHYSQIGCTQWQTQCEKCRLVHRYPKCYLRGDVKNNYIQKKQAFSGIDRLTITAPSEWLEKQIGASFLKEYTRIVVPNGVDTAVFRPRQSAIRKQYQLEYKKVILGVANVWNERKGIADMIALSARLEEPYKVVLIGLSDKQLSKLPSNILGIRRTANQTELAEWYSAADVFVNPTYEETFGMTNIEAQACGTPVVVYRTDGCPETIMDGNGLVISQGDLDELAKAVVRRSAEGKVSNLEAINQFELHNAYGRYLDLYEQLIQQ